MLNFEDLIKQVTADPTVEGSTRLLLSSIKSELLHILSEGHDTSLKVRTFALMLDNYTPQLETAVAAGIQHN